jgi:hypothetical protein
MYQFQSCDNQEAVYFELCLQRLILMLDFDITSNPQPLVSTEATV